jgi:hypothetical protein
MNWVVGLGGVTHLTSGWGHPSYVGGHTVGEKIFFASRLSGWGHPSYVGGHTVGESAAKKQPL